MLSASAPPRRARRALRAASDLRADIRGAIPVEYLTVLFMVSLVGAGAIYAMGVPLLAKFRFAQLLIMLPVP